MSTEADCPFCRPLPQSALVYENDLVVSFLPSMRLALGHALVVPKRHVEPPSTLTADEARAIMQEVERLRSRMLEHLGNGVDVWQKCRPDLPQGHNGTKVDHLHFHVVPSKPGAELYDRGIIWTFDHFSPTTEEEASEVIPLLSQVGRRIANPARQ
jgi:histidine triad (HIT) family protein